MIATGRFGLISVRPRRPGAPAQARHARERGAAAHGRSAGGLDDVPGSTARRTGRTRTWTSTRAASWSSWRATRARSRRHDRHPTRASPASTSSTCAIRSDLKLITLPAAADGPHDHVHQRLPVPVDRRSGERGRPEAGWVDRRAPDHRHRRPRPAQPEGVRRSRSTCSATTARRPTRTTCRSTAGHRLGLRPGRHARLLDARARHYDPLKGTDRRGDGGRPGALRRRRLRRRGHAVAVHAQLGAPGRSTLADGPVPGKEKPGSLIMATEEDGRAAGLRRPGEVHDLLPGGQLRRRGLALDARAQVPADAPSAAGARTGRRARRRSTTRSTAPPTTSTCASGSWRTRGTTRARGSSTSRIRRSRSRSPTTGPTAASPGRRTSTAATSTSPTTARGVEVLKVSGSAAKAAAARKELVAPRATKRHIRMVRAASRGLKPDPQLGWLCPLTKY